MQSVHLNLTGFLLFPIRTAFRLSNLTSQHSQYPPFLFSLPSCPLRLSFFPRAPRSPPDLWQNTFSFTTQKNSKMTALQKDTTDSDFTFALCVASLDHPFHVHPSGTDCRVEETGHCTQACWTGEGRWDDNVCKNITLLNQTSSMKVKTQENQQRKHTCLSLLLSQMVDEFFQLEIKKHLNKVN